MIGITIFIKNRYLLISNLTKPQINNIICTNVIITFSKIMSNDDIPFAKLFK